MRRILGHSGLTKQLTANVGYILSRLRWHAARIYTQARFAIDKSRKLPPGSIGPRCMRGVSSDDRFYLKLLEKHGPTFKLF